MSDTTPSTFTPASLAVYTRHSRGLWHPATANTSSLFLITLSTLDNAGTTTTTAPLAHCPSLADAQQHLHALALRYGAVRVPADGGAARYEIAGERGMRVLWVREVGHVRALKMVDLDDVDGGC